MRQGLRELVGRAMMDAEFFASLQRAPESVLSEYDLTDDERRAILAALDRLTHTPADRRARGLGDVLLRRVAT